jgi:hypothetical protein
MLNVAHGQSLIGEFVLRILLNVHCCLPVCSANGYAHMIRHI